MDYKDRCLIGELSRKCDEKRLEIELNKDFKVISMKGYCKAKDVKDGLFKVSKEM